MSYPADFETFWSHTNRRGPKRAAWQEWERIKARGELPELEILCDAFTLQRESTWWDTPLRYQPHVRKWLYGYQWEDELERPDIAPGAAAGIREEVEPLPPAYVADLEAYQPQETTAEDWRRAQEARKLRNR